MIIAIDPGKIGGIAYRSTSGVLEVSPMPETDGDVIALLKTIHHIDGRGTAIMELQVGAGVSFGDKNEDGTAQTVATSAMFKFGRGYGLLQGAIMTLGWRLELVSPRKWINGLSLGKRGTRTKTEWKNHLKAEAQRLYPGRHITLKTCDALLILEYWNRNNLAPVQGGLPV